MTGRYKFFLDKQATIPLYSIYTANSYYDSRLFIHIWDVSVTMGLFDSMLRVSVRRLPYRCRSGLEPTVDDIRDPLAVE